MQPSNDNATPTAGSGRFPLFTPRSPEGVLRFEVLPPPDMGLTFLPRPPPARPGKRSRPAADIDGEHSCLQKKKRRLRLFLITSRLSPQYSHPATNIVDRGSSKIAVWAKQKALGRNLIRKAAILNRVRRQTMAASTRGSDYDQSPVEQEKELQQFQMAKLEFDHGAIDTYTRPVHSTTHSVPPIAAVRTGDHFVVSGSPSTSPSPSRSPSPSSSSSPPLRATQEETASTSSYRSPNEAYANSLPEAQIPRRDYSPLPPSPLGLSNYDAFDLEGGLGRYNRFDDDDDDGEILVPYDDDDDDEVPFSPSAVTTTSATTAATSTNHALRTPPPLYEDFHLLDSNEATFAGSRKSEEKVDVRWLSKNKYPQAQQAGVPQSPNFRPSIPAPIHSPSISPNFTPRSPNISPSTTSISPNFTPASPNFPLSTASTSPNFIPISPNFTPAPLSTSTPPPPTFPHNTASPLPPNPTASSTRTSTPSLDTC
ncbi:hypothetical protein NX059_011081 [Plenodomus lindquistii]|nr:hypothetical protein NX059_011081 [Plenodomus lindquistii]